MATAKLNREYAAILAGSGNASDKFWKLEERINSDKKEVGVVAQMSRSQMEYNLLSLLREKAITLEDLDGFSEDLRERMAFVCQNWDK